jgi:S1/P1 Nuclease
VFPLFLQPIMKKIIFVVVTILCCYGTASFGWGKIGHNIVAEMASNLISDNARAKTKEFLGETSFDAASTWMDEMRSNHEYDYMKPWHYTNVEKGKKYQQNTSPDIVNKLKETISALENYKKLSKEEVKTHLLVLFHLVGDFQMPLHVGYGVDKGGNDIKVDYLGHNSNLHRVWDTDIIESEHISVDDCMAVVKNMPKSKVEELKIINLDNFNSPSFWFNEPRNLVERCYDFSNNTIDQKYVTKNKSIVEEQLAVGGIRLAAVLEHVFGSSK